jgi:hypothetical protein
MCMCIINCGCFFLLIKAIMFLISRTTNVYINTHDLCLKICTVLDDEYSGSWLDTIVMVQHQIHTCSGMSGRYRVINSFETHECWMLKLINNARVHWSPNRTYSASGVPIKWCIHSVCNVCCYMSDHSVLFYK